MDDPPATAQDPTTSDQKDPTASEDSGTAPVKQNAGEDATPDSVVGSAAMRPVFLGNLKPNYSPEDIMNIFQTPVIPPNTNQGEFQQIPVDRLDQKRGYCFVFLKDAVTATDKDNAERFVAAISGMEIENVSSALRAEFARGDGRIKRKEDDRRKNIKPSDTLFVVNFQEETTKREDLKMLFEPFGELMRIDMKRNYAFVQFRTVDEATRAKDATNGGRLEQNVLTVEYVARQRNFNDDNGGRRGGRYRYRDDRRGNGGGGYRGDRGAPFDYRSDRDHYDGRGGARYNDNRGRGRDDFRGGGRDRSPGGYRGGSPGGYRGGSPGGYRGGSPGRGRDYRRRSRSRSRSPPRHRDDRGGDRYNDDRGRSPPRGRYDERERERNEDYRDGRGGGAGGGRYEDNPRGRSPDMYRGRDDRGYRG